MDVLMILPPFDFTYTVEDFPNDQSSERTWTFTAFYRRITFAWSGPLRRFTGQDFS